LPIRDPEIRLLNELWVKIQTLKPAAAQRVATMLWEKSSERANPTFERIEPAEHALDAAGYLNAPAKTGRVLDLWPAGESEPAPAAGGAPAPGNTPAEPADRREQP
jgi:hypothetical protein